MDYLPMQDRFDYEDDVHRYASRGTVFASVLVSVLAILALNVWLDHACALNGVVTWHGVKCVENL